MCANHHALAHSGEIDRKALVDYKRRLKLNEPKETLKETVQREGIEVIPENPIVSGVLYIGQKYLNWRYGKPNTSIKREIATIFIAMCLCFVPLFYGIWVLKAQATPTWWYISTAFLILGTVLLIALAVVFERRCRNCNGYFGIRRVASKEVDREIVKTQQDTRITPIYRNTYECVYCGNTYTKNERGETENITVEDE